MKATRVEVWFATFGACLSYSISQRRKTKDERHTTSEWVKTRQGSFFCSILPNTTETTGRTNHSEIGLPHQAMWMKKELCRHCNLQINLTPLPKSFCYMTAWELYRSMGTVHIFLSQEFWAMVWGSELPRSGKDSQKKCNLYAILMIDQEIKNPE